MTEPILDANDKQQHSGPDEPWHDKVLVDAIGYTKGLVAVLDSLSEGFRRRGRELEEQRHRLAILQSERRKILDGRSELEAQIGSLTAERDDLRSKAEERARELDRLRQEAAQAQAALEASTGETQELREVTRGLEIERESLTHRNAALEEEIEKERRQAREAVAWAGQEQTASRTAREEFADAQSLIEGLQQAVNEERSRNALLENQIQSQALDISHLSMAIQAVQMLLREVADVLDSEEPTTHGQEAWAIVRPILEVFLEILGSANGPAKQPVRLAADKASVRRRVVEIVGLGRRFLQEREESVQRVQQLRAENERLSAQLAAAKREREIPREGRQPEGRPDSTPVVGEVAAEEEPRMKALRSDPDGKEEDSPGPEGPSISPQKAFPRRSSLSGVAVECMVAHSGAETVRILRGEIGRINTLGLIAAFDEQFPEGQRVVVRFSLDGEAFSFLGRVVRVQESPASPNAHVVCHHVIRFESMVSGSRDTFQALAC